MAKNTKQSIKKEDVKKYKEEIKKQKGTDKKQIIQQIATRTLLERDYQEDVLKAYQANKEVVFMASRQIGKCQLFNSQIVIKNKNTGEEKTIKIYKLYKPKTFLEKIKHFLYKIYSVLD